MDPRAHSEPVAVVVVRATVEPGIPHGFRARFTTSIDDHGHDPEPVTTMVASIEDACALLERFLTDFVAVATAR